jgi:preprotein translocase subunit SecG
LLFIICIDKKMGTVLTILVILASVLLIVVVLLQPGKGDLSSTFGGLSGQMGSMFGMTRTANILQKITRYLAIGILVVTLLINKFFLYPDTDSANRSNTVLPGTTGQAQRPGQQQQQQQGAQPGQQQKPQGAQPGQQKPVQQQQQPAQGEQKPAK